jgi:hypothetical protein
MTALTHLTIARRRLNGRALAILQTALAALAAWYLCVALLPDPKPVFACIAAVIAIGASHGQHRQRATQLVAGVVLGLAVADLILRRGRRARALDRGRPDAGRRTGRRFPGGVADRGAPA